MERKRHNSGIALVMVLGILSVMIIMAVAFAISMRTERVAAGNYADSVRARQLVQVGITRAMNRIQQDLSRNYFTVNAGSDILFVSRPYQVGMPVVVSSTGTLPSPLSTNDNPYYAIYVSDTQIRLASTYANAVIGNPVNPHVNYLNNGSGRHSIQSWLEVVNVDLNDNTLEWDYTDTLKLTFNTGTRIVLSSTGTFPSPLTNTSYYAIYVANTQIKLADSYQKALNGEAINITSPGSGGLYLSQNGQVYPPWDALSSYGTNFTTRVSQVKSEKFTRLNAYYLRVRNHYSLGDKVSVTSTETLPSPLVEDTPYYVVATLTNGISLSLSYPGIPIYIGPDPGGTHTISYYYSAGRSFIPGALWNHIAQVDSAAGTNYWEKIETLIAESNYATVGRVAYLIANCSGLLDANIVGSVGSIRGGGTNPSELAIGYMPEFWLAPGGAAAFLNRRDSPDCLYETLVELAVLNSNAFYGCPSNFTVYSHCPPGYWATNPAPAGVHTKVNLAGTAADMPDHGPGSDRWRAITNAFYLAGFSGSEAGVLYRNLIDYIDDDNCPTLYTTCVESVPMINEVVVSNHVTVAPAPSPPAPAGSSIYTVRTHVFVECWYPFIKGTNISFDVVSSASFGEPNNIKPNNQTVTVTIGPPSPNSFFVITNSMPVIFLTNATVPSIRLISTNDVRIMLGADTVDQLNSPIVLTNDISSVILGGNPSRSSIECLDPRFNANPANTNQWQQMGTTNDISLYTTNTWTKSFLSSANDGDTAMYVANRPLQSVAELGYLVYSSNYPWHTVKLYGTNLHRVLDVFAIDNNSLDTYVVVTNRGLVNPNSRQMGALATVFADMPVDEYLGGPSNRLSMASALTIAGRLHTGKLFTNLSDVGRGLTNFSDLSIMGGGSLPVSSELQKESFFRNTCGLLNVRQNLFTIIIEAQVASGGNIPRNPVRQRAVVLVWRDPYTGEMFKRKITWLKD